MDGNIQICYVYDPKTTSSARSDTGESPAGGSDTGESSTAGDDTGDAEPGSQRSRRGNEAPPGSGDGCVAGAGEYALVPMDRYSIGRFRRAPVPLHPVQLNGAGTLTESAWITGVSVLDVPGTLSVQTVTARSGEGQEGGIQWRSLPVVGSTGFDIGEVPGDSVFVVAEGVSGFTLMLVRLEWTCGTSRAGPGHSPERPWLPFAPDDVGCGGWLPQEFQILPRPSSDGGWIDIGLRGFPSLKQSARYSHGGGFDTRRWGFHVAGAMEESNADGSISLRLDTLSYGGIPLCAKGTYTLSREAASSAPGQTQ